MAQNDRDVIDEDTARVPVVLCVCGARLEGTACVHCGRGTPKTAAAASPDGSAVTQDQRASYTMDRPRR